MYNIEIFADSLDKVLKEGSADYELVVQSYNTLCSSAPVTNNSAQSRVGILDSLRVQLVALHFMINAKINRLNTDYGSKYYPIYQRWSISGTKRSHAEIEAQIFKDNVNLMIMKYDIDDYYNVSSFIQSLIKSLDQSRSTAMDVWRDKYS